MDRASPPKIDLRTAEENAAAGHRQAARDAYYGVRRRLARRASHDETASPYDLVADALFHAFADEMYAALSSPDFTHRLQERGLRIGPALDEGVPPEAPDEWAHEMLGFGDPDGTPVEPIELIDSLYAEAWRAGWEAHAAALPAGEEGNERDDC
ncbi:hypothetical protein ACIBHY_29795 [Nonomuraea sp. NPDC050547]|uniref:hypothetical protein n=1 Tax=Nonomuraea sp. NPDC050547 TaxID=3364368 RepID=UPI0037BC4E90